MNIEGYISRTGKEVIGEPKIWIDTLLAALPTPGTLFEIGSATGRDADYMENSKQGLSVTRTDKEIGFVEYMKSINKEAFVFDILSDTLHVGVFYDAFYAHMVINHFTLKQLEEILQRLARHLNPRGHVAISFPLGDNATLRNWSTVPGNVFCRYHTKEEIEPLLEGADLKTKYCIESKDAKMCYITASLS